GGGVAPGDLLEAGEARGEGFALHVVGIAAKGGVSPAQIGRIRPRVAEAAQRLQVPVAEPGRMERARQRGPVELRIMTRAGERANVHDLLDPVGAEQIEELPGGAGGVADRVDRPRARRSLAHGSSRPFDRAAASAYTPASSMPL